MAIGIFGGTFDPVHIGHLRAAEEIRESYSLEKVFFVPAYIPPHKRDKQVSGIDQRIEMLRMAIRNNPFLYLSELEVKRGGVSYSIDTIETFEKRLPRCLRTFVFPGPRRPDGACVRASVRFAGSTDGQCDLWLID